MFLREIALIPLLGLSISLCWSMPAGANETKPDSGSNIEQIGYGKTHGFAGPITIGPSVSLFAIPHPVNVGLEGKYLDQFGFQFNYGFIPDINIKNAQVRIQSLDARVRWFPFRGAFFLGGAFGTQTITAQKSATISGVNVQATVQVDSSFYTPQAGWRWVWPTGFFMGLDFGWQITSGANTTLTTNVRNILIYATSEYASLESDVKKAGNDIGNKALPSLTLIHFGWLF